jgi:phosphonate transport system substrate-binding protein
MSRMHHKAATVARAAWPLIFLLGGCGREDKPDYAPTFGDRPAMQEKTIAYIFAVYPLHNPARLFEFYAPLIDLINSQTKEFSLQLEASLNYAAFEEKLLNRKLHFALCNPYQTAQTEEHSYRVFAKRGDDERYRGVIIVRKDSGIRDVTDLKGAAISFPAPTALASCMMPKYFLKTHGLDAERECDLRYVGSQESSIMNVHQGQTKAGCTWSSPWDSFVREKPELAAALEVKWQTEPLVNNGLVARDDVPPAHVRIVADTILNLHTHEAGRQILKRMDLSRYEPATSASYEPVRTFLKHYTEAFGPPAAGKDRP